MAESSTGRKLYFVVGESSGDALGADIMEQLQVLDSDLCFAGLGGRRMQALGLESLFDITEISVMGLSGIVSRLPAILRRIKQTANDVIRQKPDMLILIDSPEFSQRVAQRVRKELPGLPVVKYVCPSVWAWRPGRARKLSAYIDHILAILPFEPRVLSELGGPDATYVGHPLSWRMRGERKPNPIPAKGEKTLVLLPGSRRSEVKLLLPDFEQVVSILAERGNALRLMLPAVDHLADDIAEQVSGWAIVPEVVTGEAAKQRAFGEAHAALAASGTVLLELALNRIPMVSIYRVDWLMRNFRFLFVGWTAALPNLIADEAIVPERVEEMVRPGWVARTLEALLNEKDPQRVAQLEGFERMALNMRLDEAPGKKAAQVVLDILEQKTPA